MKLILFLCVCLLTVGVTWAKEPLVFKDAAQEARFATLTQELRCLVCQNQSLADSDAPLAQDLRKEIHQMLQSGSSNEQIKTFLVDRYGDFVLYRPPVQGNTFVLWLMPLGLLVFGGLTVALVIRRHNRLSDDGREESES